MNYLEKILFIDLTCHQLGVPNSNHPDFYTTWEKLSEKEKAEYTELTNEIHQIWNYVNMPLIIGLNSPRVNTIFEYNELIRPVDHRILTLCSDFSIPLKEELSDDFKKAAKLIFGSDYFKWFEQ